VRIAHIIVLGALALVLAGAAPTPRPTADPGALEAVTQYVAALSRGDYAAAFGLLTSAQQHYFGDVNNFASNPRSTKYVIHKYSIIGSLSHGNVVEAMVRQETSFVNLATGGQVDGTVREPYFALRENGAWRLKQLSQPWKAYAVGASGNAQGVEVTVHRVEFYDKRIELDCTIRNDGKTAVQVLPLGKSVLDDGANKVPAMNEANFPLNDVGFFEGFRLPPGQQRAGFINFPTSQRQDADQTFTLTVAPAIFDGAEQTFGIVVGPMQLKKL